MDDQSTDDLLAAARTGDQHAFAELVGPLRGELLFPDQEQAATGGAEHERA